MSTEIVRSVDPDHVGPASRLLEFFSPGAIAEAMEAAEWDSAEMIEQLTSIARDSANNSSRERMAAMKMLSDQGREALSLHGVIRKITMEATEEQDGVKKTLTEEGLKLLESGSARTLSTLELLAAGQNTHKIIDVEPVEESHERRAVESNGTDESDPSFAGGPESEYSSNGGIDTVRRSGDSHIVVGSSVPVHGSERSGETGAESTSQGNDKGTVRGAEDERRRRIPVQHRGCHTSTEPGGASGQHQQQHREAGQHHGPGCSGKSRSTPYTPGSTRPALSRAAETGANQPVSVPGHGTNRPPDGSADPATGRATVPGPHSPDLHDGGR